MRVLSDDALLALRTSAPGTMHTIVWDDDDPRTHVLMQLHDDLCAVGLMTRTETVEDDGDGCGPYDVTVFDTTERGMRELRLQIIARTTA